MSLFPGESCIEKPLATLWRNYQQSTKPDVVMKLSVTNSGLKGFTKEHGLTEYWSHRVTYCASPPHYPKLFCWVYRHEGKKLKHELRCHAVLCTKESISKKITEELQIKLKQALVEFKKDRISKQNARLSLANSIYDNPSMPRRKILLSVGAMNYRPPLERSKSAPKLGAIEEMCSEEDEEEAEMNATQCNNWTSDNLKENLDTFFNSHTLDRRRPEMKSPRKMSCPEGVMSRTRTDSDSSHEPVSDELIDLLVQESEERRTQNETSHIETENVESRLQTLEAIAESNEMKAESDGESKLQLLPQSNFLVTDSDDGSVSSGCETASTVTSSDTEPSSLPSNFPQEEIQKEHNSESEEESIPVFDDFARAGRGSMRSYSNGLSNEGDCPSMTASEEVNHVPIGEKNTFRRRSTYPPLRVDSILNGFDAKFEPLLDNLTDVDSLNSSMDTEVFKNAGDNDSACSDESGYSELLDNGKDSIIGNTIMV